MKKKSTLLLAVFLFVFAVSVVYLADCPALAAVPELSQKGAVIEAESMTYSSNMTKAFSTSASGWYNLKVNNGLSDINTPPASTTSGDIEYEFKATEDCLYIIWVRAYASGASSDSCYVAIDNYTPYVSQAITTHGEYMWKRLEVSIEAKAGETYKFKFHRREGSLQVDQFIITGIIGYEPSGNSKVSSLPDTNDIALPDIYNDPAYNPPADEHPRVYFTDDDIAELIVNLNHSSNAPFKEIFDSYVEETNVDIGAEYNLTALDKIECKAYYYALYKDETVGRQAIDLALQTMTDWPFLSYGELNTRLNGMLISTWSEVYDWCYDLLTESEKQQFIKRSMTSASVMENGWPPSKQEAITGHGAEAQLLRVIMSFAIAVYDERPDIWQYVGGRFYDEFVPPRLFFYKAGMHIQGTSYGVYRNIWDLHAYKLITGMGVPEPYPAEEVAGMDASRLIYLRRPDGNLTLDGDTPSLYTVPMTYGYAAQAAVLLASSVGNDPYLKDEYVRATFTADKDGLTRKRGEGDESTIVNHLMFSDPDLERQSIANLPLSKYFGSPMGVMAARTGWGDGVQSNAVVAEMKIGEYYVGGHQMPAAGHFSIYYKGPLTNQGGVYDIFNSPAFNHYNHKTTASNCILVYDPNEPAENFMWGENDGGQKLDPVSLNAANGGTWTPDEEYHRAEVQGHEIDPADPIAPDYTYLKGDIAKYYSDKITDYKRSMMFLNLKDSAVPAAMVVFDKLSVKDPSFKKTWVLHGQTSPVIDGARTVWGSSPYVNSLGERYTGKMVHDIVLPDQSKLTKTVVGGEEEGWNIINGVNVPGNTQNGKDREENTYRLELSPTENNSTELFLNVIQVTDESNEAYLNVTKVENDKFVGVQLADRVVLFAKSGNRESSGIEFTTTGTGTLKYTVCDVQSGTYSVTAAGQTLTAVVTEEGGVLSFEAPAGSVSAVRTSSQVPETEVQPVELGDKVSYYVKVNNQLVNMPVDAELADGTLMFPVKNLAVKMGLNENTEFERTIYSHASQKIEVQITPSSNIIIVDGKEVAMQKPAYVKDGYLMVDIKTFAEAFNFVYHWDDWSETAYLVSNPKPAKEELVYTVNTPVITNQISSMTIEENADRPGTYSVYHLGSNPAMYTAFALVGDPVQLDFKGTDAKYPFSRKTIVRYSAEIESFVDSTVFYLYTDFSDGNTAWRNAETQKPAKNQKIKLDVVVDLSNLYVRYYIDNVLIKAMPFTAATDITSLSLNGIRVQLGDANTTTSGTKLFEVSNIKQYIYSYGTELATVQGHLASEPTVTSLTPVAQDSSRWTISSAGNGVWNVTAKRTGYTNGGFYIPFDVNMTDGVTSGFYRVSATITPKTSLYDTSNAVFNALYTVDGTNAWQYYFNSNIHSGRPNYLTKYAPVKFDMFVDKSNNMVYYYLNGRQVASNTYNAQAQGSEVILKNMGIYVVAYGIEAGDLAFQMSNVKKYTYSALATRQSVINDILSETQGVSKASLTYTKRSDHVTFTTTAGEGLKVVSADGNATFNFWMNLPESINFASSDYKYLVLQNTLKHNVPASSLELVTQLGKDATDTRVGGSNIAMHQGVEYDLKIIVDIGDKTAYSYVDNCLVNTIDLSGFTELRRMLIYLDERTGDGISAGEVDMTLFDYNAVYYPLDYTGGIDDVIALEIGTDIEDFYVKRAYYKYNNGSQRYDAYFNTSINIPEDYSVYLVSYTVDVNGTETLINSTQLSGGKDFSVQLPREFDRVRIFVWDNQISPISKSFDLAQFAN